MASTQQIRSKEGSAQQHAEPDITLANASATVAPNFRNTAELPLAPMRGDPLDYVRNGHLLSKKTNTGAVQDSVVALQQRLKDSGFAPDLPVTGHYGQLTEKAVRKVQASFGLEQDGVAGPKLLAVLDAVKARIGASSRQHREPRPEPAVATQAERAATPQISVKGAAAPVALMHVFEAEGGKTENKNDSGNKTLGVTNCGITGPVLTKYHELKGLPAPTANDMRNLSTEAITEMYTKFFWTEGRCSELPNKVGIFHMDSIVNFGGPRATRLLQGALGVPATGRMDTATLKAAHAINEDTLIERYASVRKEAYSQLAEARPKNREFLQGWLNRVENTKEFIDKTGTKNLISHYERNGTKGWDGLDEVRVNNVVLKKSPGTEHALAVRTLQEKLNQLGYTAEVDGKFGSGTEATVLEFRHERNLGLVKQWDARCQAVMDDELIGRGLSSKSSGSLALR